MPEENPNSVKTWSDEALKPYLNPEYWDGITIGQEQPWREIGPTSSRRAGRFALRQLTSYLGNHAERSVLASYDEGEEFNAFDYEPGTIMIYHKESLSAFGKVAGSAIEESRGLPLPTRPKSLGFSLPEEGRAEASETIHASMQFYYQNRVLFGVMTEMGIKKAFVSIFPDSLHREKSGRIRHLGPDPVAETPRFTIGKSFRRRTEGIQYGKEHIERVNSLEVWRTKKQRSQTHRQSILARIGRPSLVPARLGFEGA